MEVVGWFVMMGIGQVAILRLPPEKLRETNRIIESAAWGGYRTEFYPTYDYRPVLGTGEAVGGLSRMQCPSGDGAAGGLAGVGPTMAWGA